jgi:8-oxo-dGTP pyrophosphatase MutT (NUDIX family)
MKRIVPKLSASLLIVDPSGTEPRFLFGRRHERHVFMPNRYVFPGGKVDSDDARVEAKIEMNANDRAVIEASLNVRHRAKGADAIALCAIREAWEEAGHLFGKPDAFSVKQPQWQAFVQSKMAPNLSSLRLLARAITPAPYPRRYDAWFFMAFRHSISLSVDVCGPDSELDHQIWASEAESQAFDLPSITRMVLREAVQRLEADPDLCRDLPVPMFATRGEKTSRRVLSSWNT